MILDNFLSIRILGIRAIWHNSFILGLFRDPCAWKLLCFTSWATLVRKILSVLLIEQPVYVKDSLFYLLSNPCSKRVCVLLIEQPLYVKASVFYLLSNPCTWKLLCFTYWATLVRESFCFTRWAILMYENFYVLLIE